MRCLPLPVAILLGAASGAWAQAPYLVKDIDPLVASNPQFLLAVGDRVFFSARRLDIGQELWSSAGTGPSTTFVELIPGAAGPNPRPLISLHGDLLVGGWSTPVGLWMSDGTVAGTVRISDVEPDAPENTAGDGQGALFAGKEPPGGWFPFRTDGTAGGTSSVSPPLGLPPQWVSPYPYWIARFGSRYALAMTEGVWLSDGSADGTQRIADASLTCEHLRAVEGRLFLSCASAGLGEGLWVSDGTFSGTRALVTLPYRPVRPMADLDGVLFFRAFDGTASRIWKSDGTPAGTQPLSAVVPLPADLDVWSLKVSNGVVYFAGDTAASGTELWRTDGTPAGTFMLRDIEPGSGDGLTIQYMFDDHLIEPAAGGVVFQAGTTQTGSELWKSDGTSAGTVPLPEIAPGPASSSPRSLTRAGGRVFFSADDGVTGRELWAIDLAPGAARVGDLAVPEGDDGLTFANFRIALDSPPTTTVRFAYTTVDGAAQAGIDYVPQSGVLTFTPVTLLQSILVPVIGDLQDEPDEAFALQITPIGNAVVARGRGAAIVLDDDAPLLSLSNATLTEGDAGTTDATFVATLTTRDGAPSVAPAAARFVPFPGTAGAGLDFVATAGNLTFPAASPSGAQLPARVPVVGDTIDEPDETFLVRLDGQNDATVSAEPAIGTIRDDDGIDSAPPRELAHGASVRADLAPPAGGAQDRDFYVLLQHAAASYEVVVDEVSGDAVPLEVRRMAADGTTVLQSAVPVGAGSSVSLRWQSAATAADAVEHVRVESPGCGSACGSDDVYRVRFYETTLAAPRANNSGTQVTVVIVQNASSETVSGTLHLRNADGSDAGAQPFQLTPRATFVFNSSTSFPAFSGSLTVAHDGAYGSLVGKAVALEPSTGFSFDTPMTYRPR